MCHTLDSTLLTQKGDAYAQITNTFRILLVICTLAFTAAAQTGSSAGTGTALGGDGIIGGEKGNVLSTMNPQAVGNVGGNQPHTNVSTNFGLSFIISLLTNGMPLTGF